MNKIHERRLLKCAEITENAPLGRFSMKSYFHTCGSPACALGHYAAATHYRVLPRPSKDSPGYIDRPSQRIMEKHFGISEEEFGDLFVPGLSRNNEFTREGVAEYIRNFVKRKRSES